MGPSISKQGISNELLNTIMVPVRKVAGLHSFITLQRLKAGPMAFKQNQQESTYDINENGLVSVYKGHFDRRKT